MNLFDLIAWAAGGSLWRFLMVWALLTSPIACLSQARGMFVIKASR